MNWDGHKANVLTKDDKSFKGSIDAPVRDLVSTINESADFLTTSSCSGRIMLINETSKAKRKNESEFLFVSHDYVQEDRVDTILHSLQNVSGNVFFKLEPLIVHVQCRSLNHATWLLHLMKTRDQFKHSCIVSASKDKWIVSIKGMVKLEIPLMFENLRIVDDELLRKFIEIANTRMVENFNAIDSLTRFLREGHLANSLVSAVPEIDHRSMRPLALVGKPYTGNLWSPSLLKISERCFSLDLSGRYLLDLTTNKPIGIRPETDGSRPSLNSSSPLRLFKNCFIVADGDMLWALCWSPRKPNLLDFVLLRVQGDCSDVTLIHDLQWVPIETPSNPFSIGSYERYGNVLVVSKKEGVPEHAWLALCKSKDCIAVVYRPSHSQILCEVLVSTETDLTANFKHNGVRYTIDFSKFSFGPSVARQRILDELECNESIVEICDSPNCVGIHLLTKSDRIEEYTFVVPDGNASVGTCIVDCLELNHIKKDRYDIMRISQFQLEAQKVTRVIVGAQSTDHGVRLLEGFPGKVHFVAPRKALEQNS